MPARRQFLLIGGTGRLGTALVRAIGEQGAEVVAPPRATFDLLRGDLARVLATAAPTAVINAAAYNDVDGAEREANRATALRLNRDVPAELARACAGRQIPFVHVSTDYVFDGHQRVPYREGDPVAPSQVYGRTKLEGERAVLTAHTGALVVRTSTLYGADRRGGRNYVDAILAQARRARDLEVVELPVSSPTLASDLGDALLALLRVGARGLVHVVNAGGCSRLTLAAETVRAAGLADRVVIRARAAAPGCAPRPAYSVLDTGRYTRLTGQPMRPWQEALREYVVGA